MTRLTDKDSHNWTMKGFDAVISDQRKRDMLRWLQRTETRDAPTCAFLLLLREALGDGDDLTTFTNHDWDGLAQFYLADVTFVHSDTMNKLREDIARGRLKMQ